MMKKSKTYKLILLISILAIIISSMTVGRQIYLDRQPDIISFSTIHFAGYLFFMLMPVEILFTYYLVEDFNIQILLIAALFTAIAAQIIDYIMGYFLGGRIIDKLIGEKKYKKREKYINKYGGISIFIFNLFPLSSPVLSLAAGMVKYKFRYFLLYSFLGLSLKYIVLVLYFFRF